jgi:hypothetical protein
LICPLRLAGSAVLESVTATGDVDDLGGAQEAIEDGGGGGHIADKFAPFLKRSP